MWRVEEVCVSSECTEVKVIVFLTVQRQRGLCFSQYRGERVCVSYIVLVTGDVFRLNALR